MNDNRCVCMFLCVKTLDLFAAVSIVELESVMEGTVVLLDPLGRCTSEFVPTLVGSSICIIYILLTRRLRSSAIDKKEENKLVNQLRAVQLEEAEAKHIGAEKQAETRRWPKIAIKNKRKKEEAAAKKAAETKAKEEPEAAEKKTQKEQQEQEEAEAAAAAAAAKAAEEEEEEKASAQASSSGEGTRQIKTTSSKDDDEEELQAELARQRQIREEQEKEHELTLEQQRLMDESGKMLEHLRQEVFKLRSQNQQLRSDFVLLKENNQRLMDANASAGASFAALNQHAKQMSKNNAQMLDEVQSYKAQVQKLNILQVELKEELRLKQNDVHCRSTIKVALSKGVAEYHGLNTGKFTWS